MSTKIYEEQLPETRNSDVSAYLTISRHALSHMEIDEYKCDYQITVGNNYVHLSTNQMRELVRELNVFFYKEGYP